MGYHSFPYFTIKFSFNDIEKKWLESAIEIFNVQLGHETEQEEKGRITEFLKEKELITPKFHNGIQECAYTIDGDTKIYIHDLERQLTINLCEKNSFMGNQGLYYDPNNDLESELDELLIKNLCKILQIFLKEFNRKDTIRFIAHHTNNRDDTKNNFLFIGGKITQERIKIVNLLDWVFDGEEIDILPNPSYVYDY